MRSIFLYVMALLYIAAGVNHFWHEAFYLRIMPACLPGHRFLVAISGAVEILLGILLLVPFTRSFAAWGIIILLILVFPANIQMMMTYLHAGDNRLWMSIARLPLQVLLVAWAYQYTSPSPQQTAILNT
jgi:uncharacterized membrane protein